MSEGVGDAVPEFRLRRNFRKEGDWHEARRSQEAAKGSRRLKRSEAEPGPYRAKVREMVAAAVQDLQLLTENAEYAVVGGVD